MKTNKVERIFLSGGIIGLLTTNPRRALDARISQENRNGWNAIYFIPHVDTNLFVFFLRILVLFATLFLWTWGAGYLILFERERVEARTQEASGSDQTTPPTLPA